MSLASATAPSLDLTYSSPDHPPLKRHLIRSVEKLSGQTVLTNLYQEHSEAMQQSGCFFKTAIDLLGLTIDMRQANTRPVPTKGPVIFIANHPYGVLDGIVFTHLIRQVRPDAKVMANAVLCRAPQARPHLFPVDFDPSREAIRTNLHTRKSALEHLSAGGSVGLFPAGGVAASKTPFSGPALDPAWSPFLAKLVRKTGATVVPLYFAGQNSRLFQMASHASYTLRLALFLRETRRRMGSTIQVVMGDPQDGATLADLVAQSDNDAILQWLRKETFALAEMLDLPKRRVQSHQQCYQYPAHFRLQ